MPDETTTVSKEAGSRLSRTAGSATLQTGGNLVPIITRITYSLGGQAVAVRVTGDPDPDNNGLFYLYNDHLGSPGAMQISDGSQPAVVTQYTPFGGYRAGSGPNGVTDRGYTGHKQNDDLGLIYMNARYYVPNTNRWLSPDSIIPQPTNPQSLNRYSYVRNNPVIFTDPTGHRECGTAYDPACASPNSSAGNARIFYINGIVQHVFHTIEPKENGNEYQSILHALIQSFGNDNVEAIPVFNTGYDNRLEWRTAMVAESRGRGKPFSNRVANVVEKSLDFAYGNPLGPNERVILVGSSAGGTVAIEALDLLEEKGIYVDQVILRGSAVSEPWLNNVGQVDYLASEPPYADKWNYSLDINPFDEVKVQQHVVPGLPGHRISEAADPIAVQNWINEFIVSLIGN